jgi:colicin import membrane protein
MTGPAAAKTNDCNGALHCKIGYLSASPFSARRMFRIASPLLIALFAFATPALAADALAARDKADLDQAEQLRTQAAAEFATIDRDRIAGQAACATKILVNRCLDQLNEQLVERRKRVREKEVAASRLERGVKAREVAARDAEREAGRAERDQKRADEAAAYRAEDVKRREDIARRQAEQNKRIADGPARAQLELADRVARDAALTQKRSKEAEAAAARAKQAEADRQRYELKRKQYEAKQAAKPGAKTPALPPLEEQGGGLPKSVAPPPPAAPGEQAAPAGAMPPPPPPPPAL